MKNSYKTIYFNNKKLSGIFNATLSKDFYDETLFGSRTIIEENIPGRKAPYFYSMEYSPLEFTLTLGLIEPIDIYEMKRYIEMFYVPESYLPILFEREDGFLTPVYYVISTDTPKVTYLRDNDNKFYGTIELTLRCDAPYGYEEGQYTFSDMEKEILLPMTSINSTNYIIKLKNNSGRDIISENNPFILSNTSKSGEITNVGFHRFYKDETIIIDGRSKRIYTESINRRATAIYEDWNREHLELYPKNNLLKSNHSGISVEIVFRAPRLF